MTMSPQRHFPTSIVLYCYCFRALQYHIRMSNLTFYSFLFESNTEGENWNTEVCMQSYQNLNVTYISNAWYMDWTSSLRTTLFFHILRKNWSYLFSQHCYICRKYSRDINVLLQILFCRRIRSNHVSLKADTVAKQLLKNSRFNSNVEELQNRLLIASTIQSNRQPCTYVNLSINEGIGLFLQKTLNF